MIFVLQNVDGHVVAGFDAVIYLPESDFVSSGV